MVSLCYRMAHSPILPFECGKKDPLRKYFIQPFETLRLYPSFCSGRFWETLSSRHEFFLRFEKNYQNLPLSVGFRKPSKRGFCRIFRRYDHDDDRDGYDENVLWKNQRANQNGFVRARQNVPSPWRIHKQGLTIKPRGLCRIFCISY